MRKAEKAIALVAPLWLSVLAGFVLCAPAAAGADQALPAPTELAQQLESGDQKLVREAARQLREQGHPDVIRKQLKNPDAKVRANVAYAIADLRAAEFAEDMVALFSDENPKVRLEAVWLLAELALPGYEDRVAKLLEDPDRGVRVEAAYYLGAVKAVKYAKDVETLLADPEETVRKAADAALLKIQWKCDPDPLSCPACYSATVRGLLVNPHNYNYPHTCADFSPEDDRWLHFIASECPICWVLIEDGTRKVYAWYGGRGKNLGEMSDWNRPYAGRRVQATACVRPAEGDRSRPIIHAIHSLQVLQ